MTVVFNTIIDREMEDIDGEVSHLGDFIEDNITSVSSVRVADMTVEQQEAEFLLSIRERPGPGPQLTGEGWRMLIRAADREKAAFQRSKQAAIAKYGAVLVNAAERWARPRHPEISRTYLAVDPYEFFIRMYRGGYRRAMWDSARRRRSRLATRSPIPQRVETRSTLRAIQRLHDAPSRPFVGAYLLEAHRG